MKRKFIYLGLLLLPLSFSVTSCGGNSSSSDDSSDSEMTMDDEDMEDMDAASDFDFSDAAEAMDEYADLIQEYAELLEDGSMEDAAELKMRMDELYDYSEGEFGSEIDALAGLASMALDLESGMDVDLKSALGSYRDLVDLMGNIPMDAETEAVLEMTGDALDALESLESMPDLDDYDY